MTVKLEEQFNHIEDLRQDTSSDTVDINTEGLRAFNGIIREIDAIHLWEFLIKKTEFRYYNGILEYPAPANYRNMIGLYEMQNFLDPFRRVKPVTFRRLTNLSNADDLLADDFSNVKTQLLVQFINSLSARSQLLGNTSFDGNGTWEASGGASNVATDSRVYVENTGAVRFDLGATGGIITNDDPSQFDESTFGPDNGKFFKLMLPSGNLTSVEYRWGSSSSAYYSVTVTADFSGKAFRAGINQLGFLKQDATKVLSPDDENLDYHQIIFVTTLAMTAVRLSEIEIITPDIMEFEYYSDDWMFDNSASAWETTFTIDDKANDYGAWSGQHDWFANVVDYGTAAEVLDQMDEKTLAKKYRSKFIGSNYETNNVVGGMLKKAMNKLPARAKKPEPPALSVDGNRTSDYFEV